MLRSVQFDHKQCFSTIKIHNISSKRALPAKLNRVTAQILILQGVFFLCGIFAEVLG